MVTKPLLIRYGGEKRGGRRPASNNSRGGSLLHPTKLRLLSAAAALALTVPVSALAASPAAGAKPDETALDELVVTAQRREESSQKVPISMTVLGADVVSQHFRTSNDIAQMVPNVQLDTVAGFGIPRTGIRGIAQGDFNANATTSNMIYLDDMAMDTPISQGVPLWDLGRVEVLRGPQGTLFGRNATGGAIRFITSTPAAEPEGYADITLGAHDQREIHAAYSAPLSDTLRARVSYVSMNFGGDIDNVAIHQKQGKQEYQGIRGILEWRPNDDLTATLRVQTFHGDQDLLQWKTTPGAVLPGNFCGPAPNSPCANGFTSVLDIENHYGFQGLGPKTNFYKYEGAIDPNEHIEHTPVSVNIDYKLGWATLTSVTSYLSVKQSLLVDNDGTPANFLNEYDQHYSWQWSQEFRLTSTNDSPFQWIAGAYYLKESLKAALHFEATDWRGNDPGLFPNASTVMYTRGDLNHLETAAAFLHTTYQVTPKLLVTAAARYTEEKRDIDWTFRQQYQFPSSGARTTSEWVDFVRAVDSGNYGTLLAAANPLTAGASKRFGQTTWRLGLDYQLTDKTLVYGLITKGFKGGAFQPSANSFALVQQPDGTIISVRPETVVDYEAGVKSDLIPGRLRVNGSVFYYDYKNYQTNQLIQAVQILSNLAKAELYGAELEVTAIPVDNLTINLGLGAVHSEIKKAADPSLIGNKLPLAEDFNWNALVKYDFKTSFGTISPEVSAKHVGAYFGTKENEVQMGDYTLINARIGYESANGKYYGALWGTNLADTIRAVSMDDPSEFWGSNFVNLNQHRRYGVTFGVHF